MLATRGTSAGATLGLSFVSIILEALPFVMLGSLLGGLFEVFVSREWVVRLLPERKVYAILVAAGLGLLLPVCECAVIPFTRRLVRKGVPFSTAVAYLLAGPIVNVLVGSATLMAYGWNWHVLAARMGFGYFVAVAVALAMDRWFPGQTALIDPAMNGASSCGHDHSHHTGCCDDHAHDHEPAHAHASCCGEHQHEHQHEHVATHDADHSHAHAATETREVAHAHAANDHAGSAKPSIRNRLADAINHAGDDFLQVGQFLVLGAFVASVCQTLIPRQTFMTMAHAPALAIAVMMGLAVVLNLCSGADAFVAASFRSVLPLSAQMGFMVLGPMLDLKLSAMYLSLIRKRAFVALVVLMYSCVFILMLAWHYLFASGAH
ncbi:MAG TPA: permease [Tepidisphaeraceae bacterium]